MHLKREWQSLRELEWRDLDIQEVGRWPVSLQLLCGGVVTVALGLVLYGYLVMPAKQALIAAEEREQEQLAVYRDKAQRAVDLASLRASVSMRRARRDALLVMLPDDAEIPALIDAISGIARDNQLMVDAIRLREPTVKDFYIEQDFDIQVRGGYHHIAAFMAGVAGLSRIVTQHDFTLVPIGKEGELRLSMLARTYRYRSDAATEPGLESN